MKKRSLLLTLLLVLTLLVSSCGTTSPFEGSWKGTCDLTELISDAITEANSDLKEHLAFDELSIVFNYHFEGQKIRITVDKASVDGFVKHVEDGVRETLDAYMKAESSEFNGLLTLEDIAKANGAESYEAFLEQMVTAMDTASMVEPLVKEIESEGTFSYDEAQGLLSVTYSDDSKEDMKYKFEGETLVITIGDENDSFDIICVKQ